MCVSFIEIQKKPHQWRGFSVLRAEEAADMFECANCHVMKIRDFKGKRATPITPVAEYPGLGSP
jgi:hypothetical protein